MAKLSLILFWAERFAQGLAVTNTQPPLLIDATTAAPPLTTRVNRVAQHPVHAFVAALGAVAVLSIMDAVMKHLVLASAFSRSASGAHRQPHRSAPRFICRADDLADRTTLRIHIGARRRRDGDGRAVLLGHRPRPARPGDRADLHRPADLDAARRLFLHEQIGGRSIAGSVAAFAGVIVIVFGQARAQPRRTSCSAAPRSSARRSVTQSTSC